MENTFDIIELIINEDMMKGVQAISLVDEGAIERDFVHFNKEQIVKLSIEDEEKRMVMGPVLIPNKMILRAYKDENDKTNYYYVHFSKDTVRKTAQRFMEMGNQNNTTYQHMKDIDGVTFIESWVKEDVELDKSSKYGYSDLPVGTWFAIARVDNDEVWEDVKAGKINGFSIEGRFADKYIQQSKEVIDTDEELINKIIEILKK